MTIEKKREVRRIFLASETDKPAVDAGLHFKNKLLTCNYGTITLKCRCVTLTAQR
jgi:hypothetical protein